MEPTDSAQVFSRLDLYKFLEDKTFLEGWTTVRNGNTSADEETLAKKFLEAKVFYFSRFKEPVSLNGYVTWLAQKQEENLQNDEQPACDELHLEEKLSELNVNPDKTEQLLIETVQTSSVNGNTNIPVEASDQTADLTPNYPPSFYDIMQKVQNGEPIPGVEELNIEPTNTPPTSSYVQRVPKPWEQAS